MGDIFILPTTTIIILHPINLSQTFLILPFAVNAKTTNFVQLDMSNLHLNSKNKNSIY